MDNQVNQPEKNEPAAALPELPTPAPAAPAPEPTTAPPAPQAPQTAPAAPAPTPAPAAPASQPPMIAEDVDVIEKEWVDKAEQLVKQTEGDPFKEEEAIEDLQIDYLKQRYGKDIKKAQDG